MNEPVDSQARSPVSKRRRWLGRAVLAGLLLLALALAAAFGWLLMVYPGQKGPGRGRLVELDLARGERLEAVAARLRAAGALRHEPALFAAYARLRGAAARLREGETVLVYDDMSPRELLQRIARGFGSASLRVVIPEGFSRYDIAKRLARFGVCQAAPFLRATEDRRLLYELAIEGPSAEGLLFPDTYLLREGMRPEALVRRFVANARRRLAPVLTEYEPSLARLREELGFELHELLTLASIVEKEARLENERPIIAGVFFNRLRDPAFRPRRLQADPTVSYGCLVLPTAPSCMAAAKNESRAITRAMLEDGENPYNTYRHEGLPPGPIANPGLSAVRAVLAPAAHDYLYFVARGGGAHAFSRTLEDHLLAVERARGGAR